MEKEEDLDKKFQEAVDKINAYHEPLPADILLRLYAYYKIANKNFNHPGSKTPLINAFKANALIQAQSISVEEAMRHYVKLVDELRQQESKGKKGKEKK